MMDDNRMREWEWWLVRLQVLQPSPGLQSWDKRDMWCSPGTLPPCNKASTQSDAYSCLTSKGAKKDKEGEENGENEEKMRYSSILLRLQHLSVSVWKDSFLCANKREKAHFSVFTVGGIFLMWDSDSQSEKQYFAFRLSIFHLSSFKSFI